MKSVLDEIMSILLCSDARELLRSAIFLMSGVKLVRDFFDVKMKCSVPTYVEFKRTFGMSSNVTSVTGFGGALLPVIK